MNILVVDGYNVIGAWEELKRLKLRDLELARDRLIELLAEYKAYTGDRVIVVFDAMYVKGIESKESIHGVEVIYTKENETADECIERLVKSLINVKTQVYVATSDYMEQKTIFSRGALRISARELWMEINNMEKDIQEDLDKTTTEQPKIINFMDDNVRKKLEKWRRGK